MKNLQDMLEDLSNFDIKVEKGQVKILGKSGFACIDFTHNKYNSIFHVELFDNNSKYIDGSTRYYLGDAIITLTEMLKKLEKREVA
tara:strand:- start:100 stop:357 length:258 start_codon:yes stop_codon:yes gene_type:complete